MPVLRTSAPPGTEPPARARLLAGALIVACLLVSLIPTSLDHLNTDFALTADLSAGSTLRQVQLSLLFLLAGWQCARFRPAAWATVRHINPFLVLLVGYCAITALWSDYPTVTLKRVIVLSGVLLVGIASAPPLAGRTLVMRILLCTLSTICLLSIFAALTVPEIGVDRVLNNAWRGITWQKNQLGIVAAYAALLWLHEARRADLRLWVCVAGGALSLFVLAMSKSSTSILMVVLAFCVYTYWVSSWLQRNRVGWIALLGAAMLAILVLHFHYVMNGRPPTWQSIAGPVAALFDKDSGFTGRSDIWALVMASIRQHPVLGGGYGAFWLGAGGPAQYVADALHWMPPHAHNGYLDVLNELGAVGLFLFMLALAWHMLCIARLMQHDRHEAALHLAIFFVIAASNITETDFLSGTHFKNILLLLSSTTVSGRLAMLDRHRQREPAPE